MIGGRAFALQRPLFVEDAARADPDNAETYRAAGANAVLAAPLVVEGRRLGFLAVYAHRAPFFAEDDLQQIQQQADLTALLIQSHLMHGSAARLQARAEVVRLKDDFLSAAAHDLKTPLTTLLAQAQLLLWRAERQPTAPADRASIERLVEQLQGMKRLVVELLDFRRVEQGQLVGLREPVDLTGVAREICSRYDSATHPCRVTADGSIVGLFDRLRLEQLLDNLVENGVKYSPTGGPIWVRVWRSEGMAHMAVTDTGIGIPAEDLPHLFERFHRGRNVDDRRFAGMGLGLYLCRSIAEQHGGRLWASSPGPGLGSTFQVDLPLAAPTPMRPPLPTGDAPLTLGDAPNVGQQEAMGER